MKSWQKIHVIEKALVTMSAALLFYVVSFGPMWSLMVRLPGSARLNERIFWTIYEPYPMWLWKLWYPFLRQVDPEVDIQSNLGPAFGFNRTASP